jgi:hypothetical protein
VIDEAARWWRRNKVFRPSICEIRRLCVGYVAPEITVRNRLVTIIEKSDRRLGRRQNETVGLASRAIKRIPGGTGTIGR